MISCLVLFNDISTFVGYLMQNSEMVIIVWRGGKFVVVCEKCCNVCVFTLCCFLAECC